MEIVLVGLNHRTAPVEVRERVSFTAEQARRAADELRARGIFDETLVLSTCNRSEVYGVPPESAQRSASRASRLSSANSIRSAAEILIRSLYHHYDRDAVRHLFRVSAGLDSMLLGEAEILGQVRDAYKSLTNKAPPAPFSIASSKARLKSANAFAPKPTRHPPNVRRRRWRKTRRTHLRQTPPDTPRSSSAPAPSASESSPPARSRRHRPLRHESLARPRRRTRPKKFAGTVVEWADWQNALAHARCRRLLHLRRRARPLAPRPPIRHGGPRQSRTLPHGSRHTPKHRIHRRRPLQLYLYNLDDLSPSFRKIARPAKAKSPAPKPSSKNTSANFFLAGQRRTRRLRRCSPRSTARRSRRVSPRACSRESTHSRRTDREQIESMMEELLEKFARSSPPSDAATKENSAAKSRTSKPFAIFSFRQGAPVKPSASALAAACSPNGRPNSSADKFFQATGIEGEIVIIKTSGDKFAQTPLSEIGGKGVFVKELEEALLDEFDRHRRAQRQRHSHENAAPAFPFPRFCAAKISRDCLVSNNGANPLSTSPRRPRRHRQPPPPLANSPRSAPILIFAISAATSTPASAKSKAANTTPSCSPKPASTASAGASHHRSVRLPEYSCPRSARARIGVECRAERYRNSPDALEKIDDSETRQSHHRRTRSARRTRRRLPGSARRMGSLRTR